MNDSFETMIPADNKTAWDYAIEYAKKLDLTEIETTNWLRLRFSRPAALPPVPANEYGLMPGDWGIDISHHQATADWERLKAKYAFIRASNGVNPDNQFARYWPASKGKLLRGAYHYFQPELLGQRQAEKFLSLLGDDYGELPCALDVEENARHSPVELRAWLKLVESATKCKPFIYTSQNAWQVAGGYDLHEYPLWLADYSPPLNLPTGWQVAQFVQTGTARIAGFPNPVDLNFYTGGFWNIPWWARATMKGNQPAPYKAKTKILGQTIGFRDAPRSDAKIHKTRSYPAITQLDVFEITPDGWLLALKAAPAWWVHADELVAA